MAKVTLTDVERGYGAEATINANNDIIEAGFVNSIARDGESPNEMNANFDMNGKRILNLPPAVANQEPITLEQANVINGVDNPLTTETVAAVLDSATIIDLVGNAIYPRTQAEEDANIAAYVSGNTIGDIVNPHLEPGNVLRYGNNTAPGTTDMYLAIQAALDQCAETGGAEVVLPNTTLAFGTTLEFYSGTTIKGQSRQKTILDYTGSGVAITSATPGVRTYNIYLRDFWLRDSGTGTVGLDLDSASICHVTNVLVSAFDTGIKVYSATNGYSVYDRFYDVTVSGCVTGWLIGGSGSNATTLIACRANACTSKGIHILDSNEVHVLDCQIESNTTDGVYIDDGGVYGFTVNCVISNCRFENTGITGDAISINSSDCVHTTLINNKFYTTDDTVSDSGDRTHIINTGSEFNATVGDRRYTTIGGATDVGFLFQRDSNGGAGENPAFKIDETVTSTGDPVTLQVNSARSGDETVSRVIDLQLLGAQTFGVTPSGRICTNQDTANTNTPSGATVHQLPIYNEAGTLLGYIPVYESAW